MHKKDFSPSYCFHISRFQIIFPCRDIGPATATLDPRPRHWTRDRDIGPATATLDPRPRHWTRDRDIGPATRDPRLLVKLDLRQGFFATKICTASRLKVWTSFLHPFAMCLLDFWSRINELLQSFGRLKWCTSTWWKQHSGPQQLTRSSNQFYIRFCRTNKGKYSVPVQC